VTLPKLRNSGLPRLGEYLRLGSGELKAVAFAVNRFWPDARPKAHHRRDTIWRAAWKLPGERRLAGTGIVLREHIADLDRWSTTTRIPRPGWQEYLAVAAMRVYLPRLRKVTEAVAKPLPNLPLLSRVCM